MEVVVGRSARERARQLGLRRARPPSADQKTIKGYGLLRARRVASPASKGSRTGPSTRYNSWGQVKKSSSLGAGLVRIIIHVMRELPRTVRLALEDHQVVEVHG